MNLKDLCHKCYLYLEESQPIIFKNVEALNNEVRAATDEHRQAAVERASKAIKNLNDILIAGCLVSSSRYPRGKLTFVPVELEKVKNDENEYGYLIKRNSQLTATDHDKIKLTLQEKI